MQFSRRQTAAAAATTALAAAFTSPALAQSSGDAAAVAKAVEALTKAMVSVDKAQLEALTAPQLSYGHSAGKIENQKEFVDNILARNAAFRFINLSDETVSVVGNNAIARHMFTAETESRNGQVTPVRIGVMQVWQKQGNDWRLLARQAYRV